MAWIAVLIARMLVAAAIVMAASVAVTRSGPFLGAMVATLPLSTGPAYVFLARDHDAAFLAASALTSLAGVGATASFVVAYGAASRHAGTLASLAAALVAWAATVLAIGQRRWTLADAALLSGLLLGLGSVLTRGARREAVGRAAGVLRPVDMIVRAGAVMALVAAVTILGQAVGPAAAGFAATLPTVFISLILVLQPRIGGRPVAGVLAHALVGLLGYVPAYAVLHAAAVPLGPGPALGLALASCLAWSGAVILAQRYVTVR